MPRRRVIDPSIWQDEGFAELTGRQQSLFIGLFSNADDEGRLNGSATAIRLLLPAVYGGVPLEDIDADLIAVLRSMRRLVRYEVETRLYLAFTNWGKWQRIDRPSPSDLPPPPGETPQPTPVEPSTQPSIEGSGDSTNDPRTISDGARNAPPTHVPAGAPAEVKGKEEKLREGKGSAPPPADLTDSLNAMHSTLLPFTNRGYVASPESLTKCARKYPEVDLELEALKLADWLKDPRNRKELCSWRRIFNWLDRAEADRLRRLEERRRQQITDAGGPGPRPLPENLPNFGPGGLKPLDPKDFQRFQREKRGGPPTRLGAILPIAARPPS